MIDKEFKLPFYAKASMLIIGLYVLINMLYIGQSIIVPVVFAVIIAIVLHPIVNFFVRHKLPRVAAIIITLLLTFLVVAAIGSLIVNQASQFSETWPVLVDKFTRTLNETTTWISSYFDIKPKVIQAWVIKTRVELLSNSNAAIGQTIFALGSGILVLFLIPVYVFLMLFYHRLLIDFIHKLFVSSDQSQVSRIVNQTKTLIQQYLVGLAIEAVIIAVLEIAALLILGIEYAILLGVLGALLNVIPYIGGLVAVALPMLVAFATKDSAWYPLYVLVIYYVIQLIDNNYIVPIIVSSKVKINALASIVVVIAGNMLWGVPGMFLSIPLLAIIKLIFDNIDSLKAWGFLLGEDKPIKLGIKTPGIKQFKKILKSA